MAAAKLAPLVRSIVVTLLFSCRFRSAAGDLDFTFGVDPVEGPGLFGPGVLLSDRSEGAGYARESVLAIHNDVVASVRPGQSVAVFACGGVGLSAIMAARLASASPIIAVDRVESRLEIAPLNAGVHTSDVLNFDMVRLPNWSVTG